MQAAYYTPKMATELELKFSTLADDFPSAPELKSAFSGSGFGLGQPGLEIHRDRYFDDAVNSLRASGLALRRRTVEDKVNGNRVLATLKSAGNVSGAAHEREELEVLLTGYTWPPDIFERVAPITDPHLLRVKLELATERRSYPVERDGKVIAMLAFDAVEAKYVSAAQSVTFSEAEIEAVGKTSLAELEAVAAIVDRAVHLTPNSANKVERAEALLSLSL